MEDKPNRLEKRRAACELYEEKRIFGKGKKAAGFTLLSAFPLVYCYFGFLSFEILVIESGLAPQWHDLRLLYKPR